MNYQSLSGYVHGLGRHLQAPSASLAAPPPPQSTIQEQQEAQRQAFEDRLHSFQTSSGYKLWMGASFATGLAAAYHGYKRNDSAGWAIGWWLVGGIAWPLTWVIMLAQGFAKPLARNSRNRRRRRTGRGRRNPYYGPFPMPRPTDTTLQTLHEVLERGGGVIDKLATKDRKHVRMSIDTGLLEPTPGLKNRWRLTPAGETTMSDWLSRKSAGQLKGMRTGETRGTPTRLNLFALDHVLRAGGGTFHRIEQVDAPHVRRCIAAGLLEQVPGRPRGHWQLSPEGERVMEDWRADRAMGRLAGAR
jgi:hypothetical protein